MTKSLPEGLLRPDAPWQSSFAVSEAPCRAKLDQNELPFDLPAEIKAPILEELAQLAWNRYPQPRRYLEIKARFAAALDLPAEQVVLTAGCDQLILLAYWAAGGQGRQARVFEPTYPLYSHYARVTQTPLDQVICGPELALSPDKLGRRVDLLLLVSPNNPTGDGPDRELVQEALAGHGLVFVDEAYVDYAGCSVLPLLDQHPNLLIGRSLSKALLAGVRLGYGIGHPQVIAACERLLFAPYHLSALQLLVAAHFSAIRPLLAARTAQVVAERQRLQLAISSLGLRCYPSGGNFLLFAVPAANAVNQRLIAQGIRVRDVSSMPGLGSHLRVTVALPAENDLFLAALARSS